MSKNYDMIATVDIDIATPVVDDASFDNILIVGPMPKVAPETALAKVGVYSSFEEVLEAGWVAAGDNADPIGVAAQVAFSQSPRPNAVYIAVQDKVETADGVTDEDPVETIKRALAVNGWYVVCPAGVAPETYEEIAAFIETQEKMFCYTEFGFFGAGADGANAPIVKNTYFRTMAIYGRENTTQTEAEIPEANKYLNIAHVVKWLRYESGSETAAFKTLAGVTPSELTTTEMKALEEGNLNYFITVGNRNLAMNGMTVGGEWADIIRFRDWLKNDMQVRVVNLFVVNPKVPYTDAGIALVQNQMIASLKEGQNKGGIAEDEFDEDGKTISGFTTSVPLAANISSSDKASRKLKNCKFCARLAGAIHFAELRGTLSYEI